jgi:hypothetical protein
MTLLLRSVICQPCQTYQMASPAMAMMSARNPSIDLPIRERV